ncbi:MAG TPA: ribonuclease Y [Candidatus Paceibacterota bacterium]|nr:ribonuclease Y [Candidatus Paceibacterota bacterium]HRZ99877.1 ribonuclease Y [Candidatus Paceibacterota bacterium]
MSLLANSYFEGLAFLGVGVALGYLLLKWRESHFKSKQKQEAEAFLEKARQDAEAIVRESHLKANEELLAQRLDAEKSFSQRRQELAELEHRLNQRDELINRQLEGLVQQEHSLRNQENLLKQKETSLENQSKELAQQIQLRREQLLKAAHVTADEARALILKEIEEESLRDASDLSRHILEDARLRSEQEARRIISNAIQRYAGDHSFETNTATIALPNEEIKGRIIGREGRNIRAFEAATGVTVLIDDTPNAVVLSAFDPVRREIARLAMHRLIQDGRIHPSRIEEVTAKVTEEIDEAILRAGEEAIYGTGLPPMQEPIAKLLGRLKFRHSFSQNVLAHSIEVAHLAGMMAAELNLNIATAKRAGLLHDIGKAVNHEVEGAHAQIGADLVKRYGESDEVVNAVAAHHNEVAAISAIGALVSAADAISASRPGARSESMDTYLKRLENLEKIGLSFPGVEKCYAVQAGRELRVMVQPDQISDEQAFAVARTMAHKIEEGLQYPGQIRVTVIRETRCIEFAK